MEYATRLKGHDNFHKQLTAFEKLIQHAMSRFSKDRLYQMLNIAMEGIPYVRGPRIVHSQSKSEPIKSVEHLRDIVTSLQNKRRKGILKEEVVHVIKYFETFFNDLKYLRNLKKYFDEKIYQCLYEYFYDPSDDLIEMSHRPFENNFNDDADSGNFSLTEADDSKRSMSTHANSKGYETLQESTDRKNREKMSTAVSELYDINRKWERLLDEEEFNEDDFDVDSQQEIVQYADCSRFALLLRLIPDIFTKCYKAADIARTWWIQANKIYPVLPINTRAGGDFMRRVDNLERRIMGAANYIANAKRQLDSYGQDLDRLMSREERFDSLTLGCEQLEVSTISTEKKLNDAISERKGYAKKMAFAIRGTSKYFELNEKIKEFDDIITEYYYELSLLRYNFNVTQEDFLLELEVRPDFIRFSDQVKEMSDDLQLSLQAKKQEKLKMEKELVLLKTNCERMRQIMRKYVGSAESSISRLHSAGNLGLERSNDDRTFTFEMTHQKPKHRKSILDTMNQSVSQTRTPSIWSPPIDSAREENVSLLYTTKTNVLTSIIKQSSLPINKRIDDLSRDSAGLIIDQSETKLSTTSKIPRPAWHQKP